MAEKKLQEKKINDFFLFQSKHQIYITKNRSPYQQNYEQNVNLSSSTQHTLSTTQNRNTSQHYSNGISTLSVTTTANSLEPCKQSTKTDQSPTKATTVTN